MSLGENLQRLRKEKGLSQEEVARRLYVSRQSVSKWELDQSEPGVAYLKSLAELYGVTLDELAGRTAPPPISPPTETSPEATTDDDVEDHTSFYWIVFVARTVIALLENLLFTLPTGSLHFPLAWLSMLVGVFIQKEPVWWITLVCLGLDLVVSVIHLVTEPVLGVVGLLLSGIFLFIFTREQVKSFFHVPQF